MKASEIKAIAAHEASLHKTKKVLKTRSDGEKFAEYDYVPVKTVHVTVSQSGSCGAFPDCTPEDVARLTDYCMEKNLSLHEFTHSVEETEVKETEGKGKKK